MRACVFPAQTDFVIFWDIMKQQHKCQWTLLYCMHEKFVSVCCYSFIQTRSPYQCDVIVLYHISHHTIPTLLTHAHNHILVIMITHTSGIVSCHTQVVFMLVQFHWRICPWFPDAAPVVSNPDKMKLSPLQMNGAGKHSLLNIIIT